MNKTFLAVAAFGIASILPSEDARSMALDGRVDVPIDPCDGLVVASLDLYQNRFAAFFNEFTPISCPPKNNPQPKPATKTNRTKTVPAPARPKIIQTQKPAPLQTTLPQAPKARIKIEQLHKHQAVMSRKEGKNLVNQFDDFQLTYSELLSFVYSPEFESHITALLKAISKNEIIILLKSGQRALLTMDGKIEISPIESNVANPSGYSMIILVIDERPYSYLVNLDDISE
ncbi:MAG: hypothetical protein US92_C0015G0005 [Candidatus Peregrinibacteria bacterium GW2011_GWA2_38_36]|nr:MAG: hypothetical protein US92_C0015G0005 [Candidatus Peregrinibacteria bacterium GW2011_GWA2_38_36]